ncbi:MAG: tRNA pseudouridine(38-40) synthase TruA [Phycisphaerales bacterium]|nr:tRNA pseudouridine(38-40) synthase TruA [Phycisphaerales bacterium]
MPRYRLQVAYDGTAFHGWQRQVRSDGTELRTVQSVLQNAILKAVRETSPVIGASRTDSGVHAIGQVAAFSSDREFPIENLARALTSRLPEDVQVTRAEIVEDDFDPIKTARSKCYRYDFACGRPPEVWPPLFDRHIVYRTAYDLDPEPMAAAGARLVGEHDFAGLAQKHHGRDNTIRSIYACTVSSPSPRRVRLEVVGSGFLYNMVRIIAGTLLEVGRGRFPVERIDEILSTRNRRLAGQTLPPQGLCLRWIHYGDETLPPDFPERCQTTPDGTIAPDSEMSS